MLRVEHPGKPIPIVTPSDAFLIGSGHWGLWVLGTVGIGDCEYWGLWALGTVGIGDCG